MNRQEKDRLLKVYTDCLKLKRRRVLTEYGEGQMDLCRMLKVYKMRRRIKS